MTRFTRLLATSLFVVSGLFGCGGPLPAEETANAEWAVAPTTAPMSAAASSETEATSSEPMAARGTGGEVHRCGPVDKGPCGDGPICNVVCCNGDWMQAIVQCGQCQQVGNDFCSHGSRNGLKQAFWTRW